MSIRRLTLATLISLCAPAGALAFSAAPALAAAPEAPVTIGPAKAITATSAILEGTLNPGAVAKAGWYFAYSTEFTCLIGPATTPVEAEVEGQALPEHAEVTGLQPSKTYTFCMFATNVAGEATPSSNEVSFTTLASKPTVDSESISAVNSTAATLEAQVNPNNQATAAYFQYSTSATVNGSGSLTGSTQTPAPPGSALGSSYGDRPVGPAALTGLPAGSTYYYQAVATNATGVSYGAVQSFTTVPTPHTDPVSAIAATTATFNGHLTLNPVDTRYSFNYRAGTECTGGSSTPTADAGTGAGNAFVSTTATELLPGTQYTVCFVASNAFGSEQGPPVSFTTLVTEPAITSEFVTEVTATSARLGAQIDPGGAETTYHFDYGTTGAYGQETSETPIGADNSNHATPADVQALKPNTTYHYRIVATNSQSPVGGTMGPDRTFTTQSAGKGFALPDGRQYELVSPPLKDGAEVLEIGGGGETPGGGDPTQASEDGTSVTYITNAPISQRGPGNTYSTQLISTRGAGGWSSRDISPPHLHSVSTFVNEGEQFKRFSSDLSRAVLIPLYYPAEPPLAPELHQEVARGQEIYLRNNVTEAFQALDTSEPLPEAGSTGRQPMAFEGGSPDLSHVVFQGPAGLDPKYPAGGELYEWFNGQAHLVSVLPTNNEPTSGLLGGDFEGSFGIIKEGASVVDWHAVSNDGTRVFWTSSGGTYMRNSATEKTIPIPGQFQTASSEGSRVFTTEGGNLYMFDVAGEKLTNLTSNPGGGQLQEVVGANEEDTSIYVLAGAVLTEVENGQGEIAKEGANNLYLLREAPVGSGSWSTTFIADGLEEGSGESFGAEAPLAKKTVRVSPNGRYVAFMSRRSLTGYDNHDANSGQPDTEVYLYDAEANKLVCASCNPTGARPVGEYDMGEFPGSRMDPTTIWAGVWLAATIPGWTGTSAVGTSGYQPRFLSDGGQLFFTSADALVPQDVNGKDNVYEYEAAGVGSCQAPDYGQSASLVFNKTAGGCVGLISAGTGIGDSVFFDASASGSDVFFTTSDGLASQDKDGVSDMYDARVCTTAEPCPASVALPPSCTTTDSCRTAPLRQPGVFGPPPSATFEGAGNVSPTPVLANGPKPKTAAQIRAEKLAKALRACRSKPRAKRRGCEGLARKRYGKAKSSGRRIK